MKLYTEYHWPYDKEVAFIIRDDDVSYFTQPWMLDELYSEAWKLGYKVSLAVTPKVKATSRPHVPKSFRGTNRLFSINENRELVSYLLKQVAEGHVDLLQHGYTHARENGRPEFAVNDLRLIDERLKIGNRLLRETFKQDVAVFVAPHEGVSRATWKSLSWNDMCLCRKFTLGRFLMTAPFSGVNFCKLVKVAIRNPNPFKPIPNSVVDLADLLVIQWDAFFWSQSRRNTKTQLEYAKELFLKRLKGREVFVLLNHHWDYFHDAESGSMKQDMFTCFKDFLNFVSSHSGVWKTTLSELCSWIKTHYLIR